MNIPNLYIRQNQSKTLELLALLHKKLNISP